MPLTPIFHPQEDWYQAMVTKNKGILKATNRQEEWYEEIVDSMASGGLPDTTSASFGDVLTLNNSKEAVWTTPSSGGGVLVVNADENGTLDHTWQEIHDAMLSGGAAISYNENYVNSVCLANFGLDGIYFVTTGADDTYISETPNGYPHIEDSL